MEVFLRLLEIVRRLLVPVPNTPVIAGPRVQILGAVRARTLLLGPADFRVDDSGDRGREFVLQFENVGLLAVVAIGPNVMTLL